MTDGNICSSDVWRQISDAQSAVGKLKRKRERCRMERLKFIGKRLVYLVIMLFGVATLVFILTKLVPGDPVTANLSQRALGDPQIVAAYKAKYGLDQPIIVQYVYYMKNLLHFDLGTSIRTNNAVLSELARCYPATIELAVFAIILATLFGILFGVISAIKRNSIIDRSCVRFLLQVSACRVSGSHCLYYISFITSCRFCRDRAVLAMHSVHRRQ